MIRRTAIVVFTLAAIGALVGSVTGDQSRWHVWQVDAGRSIWIHLSTREFGLMYLTIDNPSKPDIRCRWTGFGFVRGRMYSQPANAYSCTSYAVFSPPWFIVGLLGGYPVFAFARGLIRRRRRRRERHRLCLKCDYDLTGNVSGVCPECGTPT